MHRRSFVAVFGGLFGPAFAAGLGASDYAYLDGYAVDPRTHALTLLLVIDRPLEDGLTKPKVRSKIRAYHQFVFSDSEFSKRHPEADLSQAVVLEIRHLGPKNALGRSVLEQIVGYAKELKFAPVAIAVGTKGGKSGGAT